MKRKVRVGAIGVGGRLRWLLKFMLERHGKQCELCAISDEAPTAMRQAKAYLKVDAPCCRDYRQVTDDPALDWIMIGSRNYLHRDHCVASFRAGKHVFCEKPMAITIPQCEDIRAAHLKSGKLFATGFVLRHAPLYCRMKKLIEQGVIGRIISMEANEHLPPYHGGYIMRNWRRIRKFNGPHLLEKCSHDIDLINWMIGDVPRRVASFAGLNIYLPRNKKTADSLRRPGDTPPLFEDWPAWENIDPFLSRKDVEDNQVAIMEYRNQVRVMFHTNCLAAYPQRRMLFCGLEGTLEADLFTGKIQYQRVGRKTKPGIINIGMWGGHGGADSIIVEDLVKCMTTGKEPKSSGEEAFHSAVTCLAIDEAMRKGRIVDLDSIWKKFGI